MLDWFHLQRTLKRALQATSGELDADYLSGVQMTLRDLLWFGKVELTLHRLEKLHAELTTSPARTALADLMTYIRNNQHGIGYAELYEQGIHVGSGPVEKAADLIINHRCKLRGMAWYHGTVDGICNLRALLFNGQKGWNEFWLN